MPLNLPLSGFASVSKSIWEARRAWATAIAASGCVLSMRFLGLLQPFELSALDWLFRLRPPEASDPRITLVTIDDRDIQQTGKWPLSDETLARLLAEIRRYEPRAIGLDIYRDIAVGAGQEELEQVFTTTPQLIGIEKLPDKVSPGISPPETLATRNQIGFNNVIVDQDSRVRRSILFWYVENQVHSSFALQLAMRYLQAEGIELKPSPQNPVDFMLGSQVFIPLTPNAGGYVGVDAGGYQILAQPRQNPNSFARVSMTDLLNGDVEPEVLRDRIVLIGSTAVSLKDFFYTSTSQGSRGSAQPIAGVELHGHLISQILSAAMDGRSLLRVWPESLEVAWIIAWAMLGVGLSWRLRHSRWLLLWLLLAASGLLGICYGAFLLAAWIPLVPSLLTFWGGSLAIIVHTAHLQVELKKSKEFLNSVINTIPDPVFVKDQYHRWIVLNEAFCRFVGRSREELLEQTDFAIFPKDQAQRFWEQDAHTFATGDETETEEALTNTLGKIYHIATKRSLHHDAAGNLFLVGVIHDITQRKHMEVELRRKAEELIRTNAELRQQENRLLHLAYHDSLTGLPNRDYFETHLHEITAQPLPPERLAALLFLDLDGFKRINDTYGHALGNLLLKAVARRLSGCLRSSDIVARFGGDEFVVLLPAIPSTPDVLVVAEKLIDALTQPFALEEQTIQITTSIGISVFPQDGTNPRDLLEKADFAMYQAKQEGKNRYQLAETVQII